VAAVTHSLNPVELALRPFTVVRTRGVFSHASDQVAAVERQVTSLGMAVVSDQAVAIGVTAVPTPEADRESDLFFVYETLQSRFVFVTAAGFDAQSMTSLYYDSKAMRKVEDGQDIVVVLETASISNGVDAVISGRMLIKLH